MEDDIELCMKKYNTHSNVNCVLSILILKLMYFTLHLYVLLCSISQIFVLTMQNCTAQAAMGKLGFQQVSRAQLGLLVLGEVWKAFGDCGIST